MIYDKSKIIKIYKTCNTKCPICKNEVTLKDVLNNNYVFSETRRKTRNLGHRICIERELLP